MQFIDTPEAQALGRPFSQAVRVGDVLCLSGALVEVECMACCGGR